MSSLNDLERLKKEKKELEEKIKILEEKEKLPKVYDPETMSSHKDYWLGWYSTYRVPDLKRGTGYTEETVHTSCRGEPELQGYVSVWNCKHPAARRWCEMTITKDISYHEKALRALLARINSYTGNK